MFYETERIIRKQVVYMKRKADDIVRSFNNKVMSSDEIVACIDIMLTDDENTETRVDVLKIARKIIISNRETLDEKTIDTKFVVNKLL